MSASPLLRIGELARRTGLSTAVLRAWERSYGLLVPQRSAAGYRLHSADDEQRVAAMKRHVDRGVPASEAARRVREAPPAAGTAELAPAARELAAALEDFDEARAQGALDALLGGRERARPELPQPGKLARFRPSTVGWSVSGSCPGC